MRLAWFTATLVAFPGTSAWADHPGGDLRRPGMDPLVAAVLWAALALLVAIIVVLIVQVFSRRGEEPEPSEHER